MLDLNKNIMKYITRTCIIIEKIAMKNQAVLTVFSLAVGLLAHCCAHTLSFESVTLVNCLVTPVSCCAA